VKPSISCYCRAILAVGGAGKKELATKMIAELPSKKLAAGETLWERKLQVGVRLLVLVMGWVRMAVL